MPREIQTAVQVANMALRVLQSRTIESFDDENDPVAQTVKMYYSNVLRRCISAYPWAFSLMERQLQRLPESPIPRWKYAYHLPADFVDLVWLRADPSGTANLTDYESVAGDLILANEAKLWARYQCEPPVPTYPHHFLEFLVDSLIEELAGVFGHNLNTQDVYRRRINNPFGTLGRAIQEERRQNPPPIQHRPSRLSAERNW
jgi:hypothetical protein